MTKKQFIWLIVALALIVLTGAAGVAAANRAREQALEMRQTMLSLVSQDTESVPFPDEPFVAKVRVEGAITAAAQDPILEMVDALIEDENNLGILLYIDSPGGEMGASDEIYLKLMDYKNETGRPIYCYFADMACSGGYYVSMASDEIVANRNCICVNIGVYISTYNFSGLFEKYGVEQINIKSSENKGIGMAGVPWTEEQKGIYQSIVDLYYEQFLEVVAAGRGMTTDQVRELDDGREMLAPQALAAGFIDEIARYEEYEKQVLDRFGEDVLLYDEEPAVSLLDSLMKYASGLKSRSEAEVWTDFMAEHDRIRVMAYAGNDY